MPYLVDTWDGPWRKVGRQQGIVPILQFPLRLDWRWAWCISTESNIKVYLLEFTSKNHAWLIDADNLMALKCGLQNNKWNLHGAELDGIEIDRLSVHFRKLSIHTSIRDRLNAKITTAGHNHMDMIRDGIYRNEDYRERHMSSIGNIIAGKVKIL